MTFVVTDEQADRVRRAHAAFVAEYGFPPDHAALRSFLAGGFGGDIREMARFWEGLVEDMPEGERAVTGAADAWRERKLAHVVRSLGGDVVEWDHRSIHACLVSPSGLSRASAELLQAEREGFALHGHEIDETGGQPVFSWYMRRRKDESEGR